LISVVVLLGFFGMNHPGLLLVAKVNQKEFKKSSKRASKVHRLGHSRVTVMLR